MIAKISQLLHKLSLKCNKINFTSSKNISIGKGFRLGQYTTTLLHPTSKVQINDNVDIRNFFNLTTGKQAEVIIHNKVFFNNNCSINCLKKIEIGENTLFGENVRLYDHNHKYDSIQVYHQEFTTDSITIGKNCWLGSNVVVLKGVTIGNNCVIGAGCVVYKDVPKNTILINNQDQIEKSNIL